MPPRTQGIPAVVGSDRTTTDERRSGQHLRWSRLFVETTAPGSARTTLGRARCCRRIRSPRAMRDGDRGGDSRARSVSRPLGGKPHTRRQEAQASIRGQRPLREERRSRDTDPGGAVPYSRFRGSIARAPVRRRAASMVCRYAGGRYRARAIAERKLVVVNPQPKLDPMVGMVASEGRARTLTTRTCGCGDADSLYSPREKEDGFADPSFGPKSHAVGRSQERCLMPMKGRIERRSRSRDDSAIAVALGAGASKPSVSQSTFFELPREGNAIGSNGMGRRETKRRKGEERLSSS